MNDVQPAQLYQLLPAIYRQRDAAQGEPLRALLAVIEAELQTITADIDGLYENWFIETCEEWVVPYIGDLLGVRGLSSETRQIFSQRSHVANVINDRRRKGVRAVLARVAQAVTGWSVHPVEYFRLLGLTQHLDHLHPGQGTTVDLRDRAAMAWLDTPFDSTARQIDVRRIASDSAQMGAGKHNIGNLGLFVWRLQSYPLTGSTAYPVAPGCFTFNPAGLDQQLFIRPQPPLAAEAAPGLANLPLPLTQAALAVDRQTEANRLYGKERSLAITHDKTLVPAQQIVSAALDQWVRPPADQVAVDVVRGRIAFGEGMAPAVVTVDYSYGFAANLGGGPYDRRHTLATPTSTTWQIRVHQVEELTPGAPTAATTTAVVTSLKDALAAWQKYTVDQKQPHGVITITDNGAYDLPLTDPPPADPASSEPPPDLPCEIKVPASGNLVIQAADGVRPLLRTPATGAQPAALKLVGDSADATLTLNGLLISAPRVVLAGPLQLVLTHVTLLPPTGDPATPRPLPSIVADAAGAAQLLITDSRVGPLRVPDSLVGLTVQDSMIDGDIDGGAPNANATPPTPGPVTSLERVTVFGRVTVRELTASEVIFTQPVFVQRRQSGMVRFSYVPEHSQTPQRYRCQPNAGSVFVQPSFTATDYRDPGYAQLGPHCPPEISAGAENGAEMGVFHHLLQPQRAANLRSVLAEYLPAGLEAGIFYVT